MFMCLCVFAVSAARVEKNSDTHKKCTTQMIHSSIKNNYFLAVNEQVIYQKSDLFGYTINVSLNKNITNTPYAEFFRYY